MENQQPDPRSIDERLDALTTNTELMSHMVKDVVERIDKLAEVSAEHARDNQRFHRIMRTAFEEYLRDDENGSAR